MKGSINKAGTLCIERSGYMQKTRCCQKTRGHNQHNYCTHLCVAFREPVEILDAVYGPGIGKPTGEFKLQLCSGVGTLHFKEFEDLRTK